MSEPIRVGPTAEICDECGAPSDGYGDIAHYATCSKALGTLVRSVRTHVVDVHERGGRFGEDVLSVKCRFCGTVWTDEKKFSQERVSDQTCPARTGPTTQQDTK